MKLIILLLTIPYIILKTKKNLHILQQNFYNENNRYIKWGNKNIKDVLNIDIIFVVLSIINIFLNNKIIFYVYIFFIVLFFVKLNTLKKEQVKIPLKLTSRIKRLIFTTIILYLLPFLFNNIYLISLIYTIILSYIL